MGSFDAPQDWCCRWGVAASQAGMDAAKEHLRINQDVAVVARMRRAQMGNVNAAVGALADGTTLRQVVLVNREVSRPSG